MKLKYFLISLTSFLLFPGFIFLRPAFAFVSDHSTINQFDSLTTNQINTAKTKRTIFFHASVGGQIDSGLRCLGGAYPTTPECMPYPAGKYDRSNWSWPAFSGGVAPDKLVEFESTVTDPGQISSYDVFGMKFCFIDTYQQSWPNYLAMMLRLPGDKIYIWTTQAITTDWNVEYDPTAAQDFNDHLRFYYAQNPNINFYDLADIESHTSTGARCTQNIGGRTLETLCPEWRAGDTSGHLSSLGGIQMAKGFWVLMANLNASPGPTSTPGPTITPGPNPTSTPIPTSTPTPTPIPGGQTNLALSGTGYRWWQNTSAVADANKFAAPGINDNNLTVDIGLSTSGVDDLANAYEGAGVVWSSAQNNITSIQFINGSYDASDNGVFSANLQLQSSTDSTAWTNTGWVVSPAYGYNQASTGNQTYTFSGPVLNNIRGIRIVGQVHTAVTTSWQARIKEVMVYNAASTPTPTPVPAPLSGDANGDGHVDGIDYVVWLNHYNISILGPSNGDFSNDGYVDGIDYVIWLNNYGK